jgi:hypothetical protein
VTGIGKPMFNRSKQRKRQIELEQASANLINAVERKLEPHDLAAGRSRLQASMRAYKENERETAVRRETCFAQTPLGRVLAAELAVYLGEHAAVSILGKIRYEQPGILEVLTAIEPSLRGFLGRDAAAAVATKIVHLLKPGDDAPLPQKGC